MSHQLMAELGGGDGGTGGDGGGVAAATSSLFRVMVMVGEVPVPAMLVAETIIVFSPSTKLTASLNSPSVTVIVLALPLSVRVASVTPGIASTVPSTVIGVA